MRSPLTASTPTTLGTMLLVAGAVWVAADRWFGYQKQVGEQMAVFNERLSAIEAFLHIPRRGP